MLSIIWLIFTIQSDGNLVIEGGKGEERGRKGGGKGENRGRTGGGKREKRGRTGGGKGEETTKHGHIHVNAFRCYNNTSNDSVYRVTDEVRYKL